MSTEPNELLAALGRASTPPEEADRAQRRRQRVLAHLEKSERELVVRERRTTRLRALGAVVGVAAAAALALIALGRTPSSSAGQREGVELRRADGRVELVTDHGESDGRARVGSLLERGERVRTGAGSGASLRLQTGAAAELGASSEAAFSNTARAEKVELAQGDVRLVVPKLGAERELSVSTFDARVTVHGTRFSVKVLGDEAKLRWTEVDLEQGVVSVDSGERHFLLHAPAHWSSRTFGEGSGEGQVAPAAVPSPTAAAPALPPPRASAKASATHAPSELPRSSTLAEENELFAHAKSLAHSGDLASAVVELDGFIARYPRSPLVQNAEVERFRALAKLGRAAQATQAARRYLATYPEGFAREEAQKLAIP